MLSFPISSARPSPSPVAEGWGGGNNPKEGYLVSMVACGCSSLRRPQQQPPAGRQSFPPPAPHGPLGGLPPPPPPVGARCLQRGERKKGTEEKRAGLPGGANAGPAREALVTSADVLSLAPFPTRTPSRDWQVRGASCPRDIARSLSPRHPTRWL